MSHIVSEEDYILIPNIQSTIKAIIPVKLKRKVAREILTAKGDPDAIYALALKHRMSLQAVGQLTWETEKTINKTPAVSADYKV
ncbi:hypothetical protein [Pseudomonas capsici]|uniref:Uncharacterized protein n=1 Tax=Pseudomonas capsici TaxID=2810614 RepID=A0ABT3BQR8_9PSED|nr:hypothetical protein [Pseudomonas capsici]MBN6712586.1 hypothetical protein [Pseudomonas capsici]MBN6717677.1 hypothetical protein [Pseudomonas capsici]MBN6723272.1 hypothetical protein [Pseudomonas capsici]MCV4267065.1 hypothetical protein [Pseudomonas capsici]MCV4276311.1 hypothetical protein [Pseudomonas capsici]